MEFVKPILAGGPIGILIWCGILLIGPIGLILSVASIIQSRRAKLHQYPLAFKLLITWICATIVLGSACVIHGVTLVSQSLGKSGAERAYALTHTLGVPAFSAGIASFLVMILLVLAGLSVMISHRRSRSLAH